MKRISFGKGRSALSCSQIVLGTHKFGGYGHNDADFQLPDERCAAILDRYVTLGGNFLDTANIYGRCNCGPTSYSEIFIGQWLKAQGNREKIVISTKGGHPYCDRFDVSRVNAYDVEHDICDSLKNLDVAYIDVYSLHRDDESTPVGEIIDVLNRYIQSGNLRMIGASNWRAERILKANRYAEENGLVGFSFSQIGYSMATISADRIGFPGAVCMDATEYNTYLQQGIPVMAFSSQAGGFFYINFDKPDEEIKGPYATAENILRLHRLRELCRLKQVPPEAIVLAYLTCNELKTLPLISAESVEMLDGMLRFADYALSADEIAYIDTGLPISAH